MGVAVRSWRDGDVGVERTKGGFDKQSVEVAVEVEGERTGGGGERT